MNPSAATTRLAILALGVALVAPSRAATLEEAQAEAATSGKLVLVDASSLGCPHCVRFNAEHESSRKLQAALERHVFVVVGDATPAGARTQARLHVKGVPTFILLTPQGDEIERWSGFGTTKEFIRQLDAAAADPTTLADKQARFESSPTGDLGRRIASTLAARSEYLEAVRYYDRAMELEPARASESASDRWFAVRMALSSGDVTYDDLLDAGERYVAAFPRGTKGRRVARSVALGLASELPDDFDRSRIRPAIERGLATYSGKLSDEDAARRDELLAALAPARTLDERLADLDAKPSVNGTFALLADLKAAGRHADAARIARRTVDLDPEHAEPLAFWALSIVADGAREGQVSVADLRSASERAITAGGGTDEAKLDAISEVARALAGGQDAELLREQVEAGLALTTNATDEAAASARTELLALQAAVLEKDGAKALALEKQSLGDGWEEDPSQTLDLAEFLLDCGIELPEAERLARAGLAAATERDARTRSSLTLARALRAQGRRDEAIVVLDAAAKASPQDVRLALALERD